MTHSKGFRHKTRSLLKKGKHLRGLSPFLTEYQVDDKVVINIDSSQVKGMPHRRFQGKVGTVKEVRNRSLLVKVLIGDKIKTVAARLEHIQLHKDAGEGKDQ